MLKKIRSILSNNKGSVRITDQLPEEQVAVCAILIEAAEADQDFAPEELRAITLQLRNYFGLGEEQVAELMAITSAAREKAVDLWPFTRAISSAYTPEKKQEVLTMVWQVIFADNRLDPYEEQLAHRLQSMLSVNHSVLMNAKAEARSIAAMEDRNR